MTSTVDYIVKGTFIDFPIAPKDLSLPSLRRGATDPCHPTLNMASHSGDECDSDLDYFDERAAPEAETFQCTLGPMQKQAMESDSAIGAFPLLSTAVPSASECDGDLDDSQEEEVVPKAVGESIAFAQGDFGSACRPNLAEFHSGSDYDGELDDLDEEIVHRAHPGPVSDSSDADYSDKVNIAEERGSQMKDLVVQSSSPMKKQAEAVTGFGGGDIVSNSPQPPFHAIAEPNSRAVSPKQLCYYVPCHLEGWFRALLAAGWNPMQSFTQVVMTSPLADTSGEWPSQALPAALRTPMDPSNSSQDEVVASGAADSTRQWPSHALPAALRKLVEQSSSSPEEAQTGLEDSSSTSLILQASSCESLEMTTSCEPLPLGKTTLMIRGIPNNVTRDGFITLLNSKDLYSKFDFFYMPRDHETGSGRGYAFVNFISHAIALDAWGRLHGFENWSEIAERYSSEKVVTLDWAKEEQQGLKKQIERYRNSSIMHPSTPEPYRPVIFQNGERVDFPAPTKRVRGLHGK